MIKISFKGKVSEVGTTVLYTVPAGKIAKVKLRAENPTRTIPSNGGSSSSSSSSLAYGSSSSSSSSSSSFFVGEQNLLSCSSSSSNSSFYHSTLVVENDMLAVADDGSSNGNSYATIMNLLFNFDATNTAIYEAIVVKLNGLRYIGKNEFILFEGEDIRVKNTKTGTGAGVGNRHETNYDFYVYEDDVL